MTKILMIEDEISFSEAITFLLKKEGFEVAVANNGQTGIELFEKNGADLILLDLMLPGLSGTEVCRQIRLKSAVPIIMLTARDTEIDKVVGLELGADDYVTKPLRGIEELVLRVKAILRRSQFTIETQAQLECGPIALDSDSHQVTLSGVPVELSPTEFRLLHVLLESKGRVLTKSYLLAEVWGITFESESTVVDTYISYLRKKLHKDGFEGIKTVRGVGFQLLAEKK